MIVGSYREFLATVGTSAGALTGLLFAPPPVAPRREPDARPAVIQQVRAAAALLAFVNSLAVSLFALVPGTNIGYPAVVLGVIGILFTAAGMRSIFASPATLGQRRRQIGLINLLLLIFGAELAAGLVLVAEPAGAAAAGDAPGPEPGDHDAGERPGQA